MQFESVLEGGISLRMYTRYPAQVYTHNLHKTNGLEYCELLIQQAFYVKISEEIEDKPVDASMALIYSPCVNGYINVCPQDWQQKH